MCAYVLAAVRGVQTAFSDQPIRAFRVRKPRLLAATLPSLPALPPHDSGHAGRPASHPGGETTRPPALQRWYNPSCHISGGSWLVRDTLPLRKNTCHSHCLYCCCLCSEELERLQREVDSSQSQLSRLQREQQAAGTRLHQQEETNRALMAQTQTQRQAHTLLEQELHTKSQLVGHTHTHTHTLAVHLVC